MKIATVTYTGTMTSVQFKGPSGTRYRMKNPMGGEPRPVDIESIPDAQHFDDQGSPFEVEWTAVGMIARSAKPPLDAFKELGYRQKQRIAKQVGIQANQKEDELEDELGPYVKDLEDQL